MFAQMKRRSSGGHNGDTTKKDNLLLLKILMFVFILFVTFIVIWWNVRDRSSSVVMIDGKQCELHFVVTGQISWGSVRGHYKTVCPSIE